MANHSDHLDDFEQLENETHELLRSCGLHPRHLLLTPEELERTDAIAEAALANIVSTTVLGDVAPRRSARRVWRFAGAVSVAATLAVALVVVRPWGGADQAVAHTPAMLHFQYVKDGGVPTTGRPARQALEDLSAKVARQPEPHGGPIQRVVVDGWWSSSDEGTGSSPGASVLIPNRVESYFLPDGRMRSIGRTGAPLDESGRISDKRGGWSDSPVNTDEIFDSSDPGPDYPQTLSTDPSKLAAQLIGDESQCMGSRGACLLSQITNLHRTYVMSSALKAALWQALANEPTIRYLGDTRDRLGRKAVAFTTISERPEFQNVIFAGPDTGAWLGDETILIKPSPGYDYTPPAVIELTAVVEAGRVTVEDLPRGTPISFE